MERTELIEERTAAIMERTAVIEETTSMVEERRASDYGETRIDRRENSCYIGDNS